MEPCMSPAMHVYRAVGNEECTSTVDGFFDVLDILVSGRFPTRLKSRGKSEFFWSGNVREFCWQSGKTGHGHPHCASVV